MNKQKNPNKMNELTNEQTDERTKKDERNEPNRKLMNTQHVEKREGNAKKFKTELILKLYFINVGSEYLFGNHFYLNFL